MGNNLSAAEEDRGTGAMRLLPPTEGGPTYLHLTRRGEGGTIIMEREGKE